MSLARLLAGLMLTLGAVDATALITPKENAVTVYGAYRDGGAFVNSSGGLFCSGG